MKTARTKSEHAFDLLGYIAASGPEGRHWVESYNPFGFIETWKDEAMASLREGRLADGRDSAYGLAPAWKLPRCRFRFYTS